MSTPPASGLSYLDAGVDINAGNELVNQIKSVAKRTTRPGVLSGLGGFGAMFELPTGYKEPVLVSGTDGVGTKLKLAMDIGRHNTIGIDLVAMCVNDLIVCGAEPLFFLDYYATGKLSLEIAGQVIKGIGEGCVQAGCALVGGETAEMPGMYEGDDYDLAGFCVGVVEKSKIIDGSQVKAGDALIGIASSGPHSNGYSLIRKIIELSKATLTENLAGKTLAEHLLTPTRLYVQSLLKLIEAQPVNALAHITGGGLSENIPRVLPTNTKAVIDRSTWQQPEIFNWLQEQGNVDKHEMLRTFNCGVGMVICVPKEVASKAIDILNAAGESAWQIGHIDSADANEAHVIFLN